MLGGTGMTLRGIRIVLGVTRSMLRAIWTKLGTTGIYWEQLDCTEGDLVWLWATGIMLEATGRKRE